MIRQRTLDPVVRDRLFAVATEAFGQHGYERASLNAILAAAGMGKSTFFYYFHDKEDLFASVIEAALAQVAKRAGPVKLPDDPARYWVEGAAILQRWGQATDAEPGFVGLLRAFQPLRRAASPRLLHVMDEARSVYRSLLARGVELGVVRADLGVDTMIQLIEAVDTVLDDELHHDPVVNAEKLQAHRSRLMDLVQRLIRIA